MLLSDYLDIAEGPAGACVWNRGRLREDDQTESRAAAFVADEVMRYRCKGAPASLQLWRHAVSTERVLTADEAARVTPFVRTAFGLPARPLPPDHVQGYVAEFVWFLLASELVLPDRQLRHLEGPGFHVTGPGGDGLAVFGTPRGLIFRLWEIKKHSSASHVSTTIARAYRQLDRHATEYLAQLTGLGPSLTPDLAALFADLVELWVEAGEACGVGVAVSTSDSHLPRRCFTTMDEWFPRLAGEGQLEGLVVSLGDLPAFAEAVKQVVWSAL